MKTVLEALLFGDSFEWADAVDAMSAIRYQWFGPNPQTPSFWWPDVIIGGTRRDIANAILSLPGIVAVGVADQSDDHRIEPGTVELLVRFESMSMTNEQMTESDWGLLEAEVEQQLYNTLAAGIGHRVVYELA